MFFHTSLHGNSKSSGDLRVLLGLVVGSLLLECQSWNPTPSISPNSPRSYKDHPSGVEVYLSCRMKTDGLPARPSFRLPARIWSSGLCSADGWTLHACGDLVPSITSATHAHEELLNICHLHLQHAQVIFTRHHFDLLLAPIRHHLSTRGHELHPRSDCTGMTSPQNAVPSSSGIANVRSTRTDGYPQFLTLVMAATSPSTFKCFSNRLPRPPHCHSFVCFFDRHVSPLNQVSLPLVSTLALLPRPNPADVPASGSCLVPTSHKASKRFVSMVAQRPPIYVEAPLRDSSSRFSFVSSSTLSVA